MTVGLFAAGSIIYSANRSASLDGPSSPKQLQGIELVLAETSFEEFEYWPPNPQPINSRANFYGKLSSSDLACRTGRSITVYKVSGVGSVPDLPVATSTSDTSGNSGNFTTTDYHDPIVTEDQYYAVVAATDDCAAATSETITL